MTAGNASGINDGAAAVVVATADARPAARTNAAGAGRLVRMPPASIPRSWGWDRSTQSARRSSAPGSPSQDIDLFELNEAFAAQALAVARELGLDAAKVNTRGRRRGPRPSHWRQRRQDTDHAHLCTPRPRGRQGSCHRCASAAAWASRWSCPSGAVGLGPAGNFAGGASV